MNLFSILNIFGIGTKLQRLFLARKGVRIGTYCYIASTAHIDAMTIIGDDTTISENVRRTCNQR
jgi:UDP-3-O-[3-hydroxymyristoyl] glucosamine N-acyltransferase